MLNKPEESSKPQNPSEDKLNIFQLSGFLKIISEPQIDWDLGLSSYTIEGNQFNTGLFAYSNLTIKPNNYLSIRLRPSVGKINGNTISDIEASFGVSYIKGLIGKMGYQAIITPNTSLHGPFMGVEYGF